MAEDEPKNVLSAFITFINKFFLDYSMWLWLFIFAGGLLIAIRLGEMTENLSSPTGIQTLQVFVWFCFCMIMNATRSQDYLLLAVGGAYRHVRSSAKHYWEIKRARKAFKKIMSCDCVERDWLVWYMYVERESPKFINYRMRTDSSHSWADVVASYMVTEQGVFEARNKNSDGKKLFFSSDYFFLYEKFDFKNELRLILKEHPGLRPELQQIREEVKGSKEAFLSKKGYAKDANIVITDELGS